MAVFLINMILKTKYIVCFKTLIFISLLFLYYHIKNTAIALVLYYPDELEQIHYPLDEWMYTERIRILGNMHNIERNLM